jgi:hypothetical protein
MFTIISCKREDSTLKNDLYYNNCSYEIPKGFITTFGIKEHPELFAHIICLYSESRSILQSNPTITITGEGDMLLLIFCSSTKEFSNSTFNFASMEELTPNTFEGFFSFDINENCAEILSYINEGSVKIEKKSSNYTISIECIDIAGKELSGYFNGKLRIEYIDNSKKFFLFENLDIINQVQIN